MCTCGSKVNFYHVGKNTRGLMGNLGTAAERSALDPQRGRVKTKVAEMQVLFVENRRQMSNNPKNGRASHLCSDGSRLHPGGSGFPNWTGWQQHPAAPPANPLLPI